MKKLTKNEFIEKSNVIHKNKYDYSKIVYVNNDIKIEILCPEHGCFWQVPHSHLNNHGCPKCVGLNKLTTEEFIYKANIVHNKNYDYSKTVYVNTTSKLTIICKIHGEFSQKPNGHLNGRGCPHCSNNFKLTTETFINKSNLIHNNYYNYERVKYVNNHTKIIIICPIHGCFLQKPNNHLLGRGCKNCSTKKSKPEREFLDFLNIKKENRQIKIQKFLVDALKNNIVYEFLGDFWHGNPQKYNRNKINSVNKQTFGELYDDTLKKFKLLNKENYTIQYIWESDWNMWIKNKNNPIPIKTFDGKFI